MIDYQTMFNLALGLGGILWTAAMGLIIWTAGSLFKRLDHLDRQNADQIKQLHEVREMLPSEYVKQSDLKEALDSIYEKFRVLDGTPPQPPRKRR